MSQFAAVRIEQKFQATAAAITRKKKELNGALITAANQGVLR
jgi:hypothetical protein